MWPLEWSRRLLLTGVMVAVLSLSGYWLWTQRDSHSQLADESVRNEILNQAVAASQVRLKLKLKLVTALAEARISLYEAATQLRDHHGDEPSLPGVFSGRDLVNTLPGRTEEEKCARCLLNWVKSWVRMRPEMGTEAITRLQRELEETWGPEAH